MPRIVNGDLGFQVGSILHSDPPRHSRLRRTVSKSFAPRVVANFERWVRDVVIEVLDDAVALGEFDWVTEVAALIPSRVIAKVVGVPDSFRENIVQWTNEIFLASADLSRPENLATQRERVGAILDYVVELREDKLKSPSDDIISYLAALVRDGELSESEYRLFAQNFINAGFETTHTTMGQSMRMIVEDAAVATKFVEVMATGGADPIVDEFLRLITPVIAFMRTATRDVEFSGTAIREGDAVGIFYAAANRDPRLYENPGQFIPGRPNADLHLAFGTGPHRCLGMALAKLELRILFEEVYRRRLRLQLNGTPKAGWSVFIDQLTSLPVKVVSTHD
jgi:cytochrome P450